MDVGAVERVLPVVQVGVRRGPGDVAPALGVEGAVRMQEDSYRETGKERDRGMDEEAESSEEMLEENSEVTDPACESEPIGTVNFFA